MSSSIRGSEGPSDTATVPKRAPARDFIFCLAAAKPLEPNLWPAEIKNYKCKTRAVKWRQVRVTSRNTRNSQFLRWFLVSQGQKGRETPRFFQRCMRTLSHPAAAQRPSFSTFSGASVPFWKRQMVLLLIQAYYPNRCQCATGY